MIDAGAVFFICFSALTHLAGYFQTGGRWEGISVSLKHITNLAELNKERRDGKRTDEWKRQTRRRRGIK